MKKKFGMLTVLCETSSDRFGKKRVVCLCSCGNQVTTRRYSLETGATKSCGCLQKRTGYKHGGYGSVEYSAFIAAKRRCTDADHPAYKDYGGRGVLFLFNSFSEFYSDIGPKPTNRHSLDRIDNNKHYEKGNVRWATANQQQNNRRNNILLSCNGSRLSISEWSRKIGLSYGTIWRRLHNGWSVDKTLMTPLYISKARKK